MTSDPVSPEEWAAEGERVAGALEDVAAALVIGRESRVAAQVALGIAKAQRGDRRVAVGDVAGDLPELRGTPDAPGLLECFRDGLPVSAIATPHLEDARLFILPSGNGPVAERLVLESARWPRLIAGFREVDALLLIVVPADAPGLPTLIAQVDGVIAVDLPPAVMRAWPLLATVDRPEQELPPLAPLPPHPRELSRARLLRRLRIGAVAVLCASGAGALGWWLTQRSAARDAQVAAEESVHAAGPALASDGVPGAAGGTAADTITLGAVVNPGDSLRSSHFALELVAANTPAGANSSLAMRGLQLPAPTVSPVQLGADGRTWYRALTGAWRDRAEAEAFLVSLRDRGLVRQDVGRVLRAPYALLLAESVPPGAVPAALAQWEARGIDAYALLQDDGNARLFAGAFETPGQSVLLALSLRDAGAVPVVAVRTGRTF
ncbi:MAG: SPOR domain-containing protein [Gemmatimonadaceae bacterium]|nr:SPOR domain-containing protein [Gemmatimonadaceae bacterium]